MLELLKYSDAVICVLLIALVLIQNKNVSLNLSSMGWWIGPVSKRDAEKERKHRRSGKPRSRNQIGRCTERQGYIGEQNRFNGRIQ